MGIIILIVLIVIGLIFMADDEKVKARRERYGILDED